MPQPHNLLARRLSNYNRSSGRYIHSTAAMIHIDDIEAVKNMILEIIKDFDYKRLEELRND